MRSWRRGRQALLAVTVMVLVTLGCASGAQADAAFEGSSPGNGETVAEPLTEIELRFSDPVNLIESETRLLDTEGTELVYEPVEIDGGNAWLLEPAISLDEGIYGVVWQAEAADGHTVRGVVRFGVGEVVLAEPAVEDKGTEASGDLETELAAAEELGTGGGGGPVASIAS
ncbi:MAG: copper resistance CopC family protein, partial [Actinomycetota bacterium]|nr:copper resistance CopC family protein [Actinomycetota bacterium]